MLMELDHERTALLRLMQGIPGAAVSPRILDARIGLEHIEDEMRRIVRADN
jgi:hypothetical protein